MLSHFQGLPSRRVPPAMQIATVAKPSCCVEIEKGFVDGRRDCRWSTASGCGVGVRELRLVEHPDPQRCYRFYRRSPALHVVSTIEPHHPQRNNGSLEWCQSRVNKEGYSVGTPEAHAVCEGIGRHLAT